VSGGNGGEGGGLGQGGATMGQLHHLASDQTAGGAENIAYQLVWQFFSIFTLKTKRRHPLPQ